MNILNGCKTKRPYPKTELKNMVVNYNSDAKTLPHS